MTVSMRRAIVDLDRAQRRALATMIDVSREDLTDFAELPDFVLPQAAMAALEEWWPTHQLRLILKDPSRGPHLSDICAATGVPLKDYEDFLAGENNLSQPDRDKLRSFALGQYSLTHTGRYLPPRQSPQVEGALGTSAQLPDDLRRWGECIRKIRALPLAEVEAFVAKQKAA